MSDPRRLRVAVLFGGRSAEHEISLLSARNVVDALDRDRFEPVLVGIDKEGRWSLQDERLLLEAPRDPRLQRLESSRPDVALAAHPGPSGEASLAVASQGPRGIDVVFPVLHGPFGEDGCVQGLLELAGVPYVGAGVLGSSVGMDKDVMKRLLREAGLPIVPHRTIRRAAWAKARAEELAAAEATAGLPCFVKPANLGSSVGVSRAKTRDELAAAIDLAFAYDVKVLVERGVSGAREIECAVLGNDDPVASIPGEIVVDHPDGFYSYTAKYVDERGAVTRIPAELSEARAEEVRALALATFRALECEGLARVDFLLGADDVLYVNEINTLPGFTAISMYPKLWEASGVDRKALVTRLVELALERAEVRRALRTTA